MTKTEWNITTAHGKNITAGRRLSLIRGCREIPKEMKQAPKLNAIKISFHLQSCVEVVKSIKATMPKLTANNSKDFKIRRYSRTLEDILLLRS